MHAAPAVRIALGAGGPWRVAAIALSTAALGGVTLWAAQRSDLGSAIAAALSWAYAGRLAWRDARAPGRAFCWDGASWWLESGAAQPLCGEVAVAMDFGSALLVRFVPAAAPPWRGLWLPLHRGAAPAEWHALRCALYAPRPAAPGV